MRPLERNLLKFSAYALIVVVLAAILFPVFAPAGYGHHRRSCLGNQRQLGISLILYAEDTDGRLPDRDHWMDASLKYVKDESRNRCPDAKIPYGYAFNAALGQTKTKSLPDPSVTPMVYDSVAPIRNASDRFTSLPHPGRHDGGNYVVYADSHGKLVK